MYFLLKHGVYSSNRYVSLPEGICRSTLEPTVGVTNFHPKGMVRADTLLERIQKWHPNWKVQVSIYTYFRFLGPAALNPVRVGKYSSFLHCLGRTQGLYTYISRLKSGKNVCNFQTTRITLKPNIMMRMW